MSLGKRKRSQPRDEDESHPEDEDVLRARFQRAFEAKFRPLERSTTGPVKDERPALDDGHEESDDSDWSGFSEADEDDVQVVAHSAPNGRHKDMDRSQQRAYMSSKPPPSTEKPTPNVKAKKKADDAEDASEAANLKHDLALQRLLKESHLLDPGTFSGTSKSSNPTGKGRLKALDLRLQSLGAKTSLSSQDKMPIAHRKGIATKAVSREEKRRKDAAENGVILEKKARQSVSKEQRRERSVGGPNVGKFRGGTLRLSGKDVRDIQGPSQKQRKGKKVRR